MDFFKIHLKEIIIVCITIVVFISCCIYIYYSTTYDSSKVVEEISPSIVQPSSEEIYVDIKGEINSPGVYKIKSSLILQELIDIAGGLTSTADTSSLNLASPVIGGTMIFIPSISESSETTPSSTSSKISINYSNLDKLQELPGIGMTKAQNIINYRTDNGPFKSLEELQNVPGIGSSTYEKLKEYICL